MFPSFRWTRLTVLTAVVFAALLGTAVSAAPVAAIGVVDFQVVLEKYDGALDANAKFQKYAQDVYANANALSAGLGLSEDDFALYQKLMSQKAENKGTDEEKIAELEKRAKENMDAFQKFDTDVKAGTKLADADQAKYEELEKQVYAVYGKLTELEDKIKKDIDAMGQRYQEKLTGFINAAISKLAQDQKLTLVLSKNVQTGNGIEQFVLWNDANVDITDKVLKSLNDSYNPKMLDPQ